MKSSSKFFPARLIRADVQGELTEDVYLIKPGNSNDPSVEIAVTHLRPVKQISRALVKSRPAVVLLHGNYQNRGLWLSQGSDCIARRLVAAGCHVWLMEQRGHGLSPVNKQYESNTLGDYARFDIPAVNCFVREKSRKIPHWIACSEGAASVLMSLASGRLQQQNIQSLIGLGRPAQLPRGASMPGAHRYVTLLKGYNTNSKIGPEHEPINILRELTKELSPFSYFGASMNVRINQSLTSLRLPLVLLADPEQSFIEDIAKLKTNVFSRVNIDVPEDSFSAEQMSISLMDSTMLDCLSEPLLDFLEKGVIDDILPAGEASPVM